MAARSRFSTSTVIDSEYLVPWLSAEGPLAYSPTDPPAKDYFFQYTWILPGIFNPHVNLREHRYFGCPLKDSARFLFDFWANARRGDGLALQRYCQFGFFSDNELRTPMAAYHHVRDYRDTPGSWVSLEVPRRACKTQHIGDCALCRHCCARGSGGASIQLHSHSGHVRAPAFLIYLRPLDLNCTHASGRHFRHSRASSPRSYRRHAWLRSHPPRGRHRRPCHTRPASPVSSADGDSRQYR